jgi:Ras-related protein Rab-2A
MQGDKFDYAIKFIVVGDVGVGKSSLISRFITGQYNPNHDLTVGIEFGDKKIAVNNRILKLQIWDTAGQ